jgi:hypothetical protein
LRSRADSKHDKSKGGAAAPFFIQQGADATPSLGRAVFWLLLLLGIFDEKKPKVHLHFGRLVMLSTTYCSYPQK